MGMVPDSTHVIYELLCAGEEMSACKDREDLFRTLCVRVRSALGADATLLYSVGSTADGTHLVPVGWCLEDVQGGQWRDTLEDGHLPADPFLEAAMDAGTPWYRDDDAHAARVAVPVRSEGRVTWLLEIRVPQSPEPRLLQAVVMLVRTFEHLVAQWAYANLDTLTRLLNRKTFDSQFEHLIRLAETETTHNGERRHPDMAYPCWLAIVDIDHFKRINDTWGHLFGDEVLILMAKCMREAFRSDDTLFRFGGEEFVVMLRHTPEISAGPVFERFRRTVETYGFPQVGQVTCSVGFCRLEEHRTPAELLGRADVALYYAKEHGRNRVCYYDNLVKDGLIKPNAPVKQNDAELFF